MHQIKASEYIHQDENINIFKYAATAQEQTHTHEFIEIVYCLSGSGRHCINGSFYEVEKGDLLFINFGQTHSFQASGIMEIVNCLISPRFIDQELIHSENALEILALSTFHDFGSRVEKLVPIIRFKGKELLEVETLIERMINEFHEKQINYKTALKGYLLVLLTKIFREMQKTGLGHVIQQVNKITPVILEYIEKNCFEKISLKELAQKCFYNPSYFSRIFKDCYGKSLTDFIHEKRVTEALRLMSETSLTIEAIIHQVGYSDRKQFYKIFRQHTGMTPSQARSTLKK